MEVAATHSHFSTEKKTLGSEEFFFTITPDTSSQSCFAEELSSVFNQYNQEMNSANTPLKESLFVNVYLSDSANQEDLVRKSPQFKELLASNIAVSVLQTPPLGSKIALLAYHVKRDRLNKESIPLNGFDPRSSATKTWNNGYTHYYLKNILASQDSPQSIENQTDELFLDLKSNLDGHNIPLSNIIRTWLYVHDIDNNYMGMVNSRKNLFHKWGVNQDTNYPASTGIEGRTANCHQLLCLDAIVVDGLNNEQIQKMEAPTHMNPTIEYGVTFERGLEIKYGDRAHLYVSGTASIDNQGEILFEHNIEKQADRTLDNIEVLLKNSQASLGDITYLVVYLRDFNDASKVKAHIEKRVTTSIPLLMLQAKVCRPGWLIEIEGMAITNNSNPNFPNY